MIWAAVAPVALWALVRVFGLDRGFPLVALMAFTPYVAIAALLVAGIALALRNWAAAAVAGLATLCLALAVLPRAVGDGTEAAAGRETLTVLSANIHYGTPDPETLVALVDRFRPDVLSVQEMIPRFARELRRAGLQRRLPNVILALRRDTSGAGIYSRLPMRELAEDPVLPVRQLRAELVLPDGRRVRFVNVHPHPPGFGNVGSWKEALGALPTAGSGAPWVLAGDFNATLDQSQLRDVVARGYRDAGEVAGEGLAPTWPTGAWPLRLPAVTIDHVLADRRLGVVDYEVEDLPGSDHRAIRAELVLP